MLIYYTLWTQLDWLEPYRWIWIDSTRLQFRDMSARAPNFKTIPWFSKSPKRAPRRRRALSESLEELRITSQIGRSSRNALRELPRLPVTLISLFSRRSQLQDSSMISDESSKIGTECVRMDWYGSRRYGHESTVRHIWMNVDLKKKTLICVSQSISKCTENGWAKQHNT